MSATISFLLVSAFFSLHVFPFCSFISYYAYDVTMRMHAYMYVSYVFKYGSDFHHMKKLTTFTILMCACVLFVWLVLAG